MERFGVGRFAKWSFDVVVSVEGCGLFCVVVCCNMLGV